MDATGWIIVGIIVVLLVISFLTPNHMAYQCPNCKETFVPKKKEMLIHVSAKQLLKCPHCGQKSLMEPVGKE